MQPSYLSRVIGAARRTQQLARSDEALIAGLRDALNDDRELEALRQVLLVLAGFALELTQANGDLLAG